MRLALVLSLMLFFSGQEMDPRTELGLAVPRPVVAPPHGGPDHPLALVGAEIVVNDARGRPVAGVSVRARHVLLDLSDGPAVTDDAGIAVIRLPRGRWRIDLTRAEAPAVFARTDFEVSGPGPVVLALRHPRKVRFRTRHGAESRPDEVRLTFPDLSESLSVPVHDDRISVAGFNFRLDLQAVSRGDRRPGYVLRRHLRADESVVVVDPEHATEHVFEGRAGRKLTAAYRSVDPLPIELDFTTTRRRSVLLSGLPAVGLSLVVTSGEASVGFYARPFDVDEKTRTFTGAPPFTPSVGYVVNDSKIFGKARGSLGVRVFLLEENGLLVRGRSRGAPYTIEWEERLDGKARAKGTMRNWYFEQTPKIEKKDLPRLRYRLRVRGPGMNGSFDLVPHPQSEEVVAGKVHIRAHPEIAANVRRWAAAVNEALVSYEEVTNVRRQRVDIKLFSRMPSRTAGFGGNRGASRGFMYLPESLVFGWLGPFTWTKLLGHELGHVQGYGHGKTMLRAGNRAGRRHRARRLGPHRVPMGDIHRGFLEAVTKGEDLAPPNLGTTGEDGVLAWLIRRYGGHEGIAGWRRHRTTWRWHLVRRGYTDAEVEAAMAVHAAGEALVEGARLSGHVATRERVLAAAAVLAEAKFAWAAERTRILRKWSRMDFAAVEDLDASVASMSAELGSRKARVAALLAIAEQRGRREDGIAALAEAAKGSPALYDETLDRLVAILGSR